MWEEVIIEDPITVAVWEEDLEVEDCWVHIYRNGVRIHEFLIPEEAKLIIQEMQELEAERSSGYGEDNGL